MGGILLVLEDGENGETREVSDVADEVDDKGASSETHPREGGGGGSLGR